MLCSALSRGVKSIRSQVNLTWLLIDLTPIIRRLISVCFITKNEEKWIGECIEHLKPLVAEFILVDTGSTDKTIAIAQERGAKIWTIEWPGDFAAARNVSLSHAT